MKLTFDVPDEYAVGIRQVMNEVLVGLKEPEFPQSGDDYYYIFSDGRIGDDCYTNSFSESERVKLGNCFKTKEEAEFKTEQLKVLHELEQLADDDQPWDGCHNIHWYITCIIINQVPIEVIVRPGCQLILNPYYFKSKESAMAAIKKIGVNRLKKYYFCMRIILTSTM